LICDLPGCGPAAELLYSVFAHCLVSRAQKTETGAVKGAPKKMNSDRYGRTINYLRISITDHCNLQCSYCVPFSGRPKLNHGDILTYEEILTITRLAVESGINKVRLTGGEPLLRRGIVDFCRQLSAIQGLDEITLTTNGILLAKMADDLRDAGISRVNISLDTLNREIFKNITGRDRLDHVLKGIQAAEDAGMTPIKINAVALRGINDNEISTLTQLSLDRPYHIRFIELMPTSGWDDGDHKAHFMPVTEVKEMVQRLGKLEPVMDQQGNGPAQTYRLKGAQGTVGFIAALSNHFCKDCNRIRLTSDGNLRNCLFSDNEIDIKTPLRQGASDEALSRIIEDAIRTKPLGHHCGDNESKPANGRLMRAIGG
jgi:cyclic pyranopterin phosphate synthase